MLDRFVRMPAWAAWFRRQWCDDGDSRPAMRGPQPCKCCCLFLGEFAVEMVSCLVASWCSHDMAEVMWFFHHKGGSVFVNLHDLCRFEFPHLKVSVSIYLCLQCCFL